jgi:hypothetical protein
MKIFSVGAELFHADGQTDMTKAPKKYFLIFLYREWLNSQEIKCQRKCCSDLKDGKNGISAVSCVVICPLAPSYKASHHVPYPASPSYHICYIQRN